MPGERARKGEDPTIASNRMAREFFGALLRSLEERTTSSDRWFPVVPAASLLHPLLWTVRSVYLPSEHLEKTMEWLRSKLVELLPEERSAKVAAVAAPAVTLPVNAITGDKVVSLLRKRPTSLSPQDRVVQLLENYDDFCVELCTMKLGENVQLSSVLELAKDDALTKELLLALTERCKTCPDIGALVSLARILLPTPATQAATERMGSVAGNISSNQRTRITNENLALKVFLQSHQAFIIEHLHVSYNKRFGLQVVSEKNEKKD